MKKRGTAITSLLAGLLLLVVAGCAGLEPFNSDTDTLSVNVTAPEILSVEVINPQAQVELVDAAGEPLAVDEATGTILNMSFSHWLTHEGQAYILTGQAEGLDNGEVFNLTVITPDSAQRMRMLFSAEGELGIHVRVYEGATVNATGTPVTPINRERNSSNTSNSTCREGDTFASLGTLLWQWHSGGRKVAGNARESEEIVLLQDSTYILQIESHADNNVVSGLANWYETQ